MTTHPQPYNGYAYAKRPKRSTPRTEQGWYGFGILLAVLLGIFGLWWLAFDRSAPSNDVGYDDTYVPYYLRDGYEGEYPTGDYLGGGVVDESGYGDDFYNDPCGC